MMQILLVGKKTSVTDTVSQMLESVEPWSVKRTTSWKFTEQKKVSELSDSTTLDIIVANLADFCESSISIIQNITSCFSSVPLLVLYSYNQEGFIKPLIEAGATGYLQNGHSENELLKAVQIVADGNEYITTENTY